MRVSIAPLGDRVFLRRINRPERTSGGIVLPKSTQERSQLGRVLAVGDKAQRVRPGDIVLFSSWAASALAIIGEFPEYESETDQAKIVVIREGDILAVQSSEGLEIELPGEAS